MIVMIRYLVIELRVILFGGLGCEVRVGLIECYLVVFIDKTVRTLICGFEFLLYGFLFLNILIFGIWKLYIINIILTFILIII